MLICLQQFNQPTTESVFEYNITWHISFFEYIYIFLPLGLSSKICIQHSCLINSVIKLMYDGVLINIRAVKNSILEKKLSTVINPLTNSEEEGYRVANPFSNK